MKNSIYDRLEGATTESLLRLREMFARIVEHREKTPSRHDYHGKCLNRCTQILERRGELPTEKPERRRRSTPIRS